MLLGRSSGLGLIGGDELAAAAARAAAAEMCASLPFASCLTSTLAIDSAAVEWWSAACTVGGAAVDVTMGEMPAFLLMMALSRLLDDERFNEFRADSSDCAAV